MYDDGFININKDLGISSQNAVTAIKRLLHMKAGHCGTLDPLATGVLPICLGRATRLSDIVMGQKKVYIGQICFGVATDSYDKAGSITDSSDASRLTKEAVLEILGNFIGQINQVPPVFSSIKQDGVPLYKRARRGEDIQLQSRKVQIDDLQLLEFIPGEKAYATIQVKCGKGTYIRSLAFDIGADLGLPAHLSSLIRSKTGFFELTDAYTIDQIGQMIEAKDYSFITPMNQVLTHLPKITASVPELIAISHGNDIRCNLDLADGCQIYIVDELSRLLAVGTIVTNNLEQRIQMDKVFIDPQNNTSCAIGNFDGLHLGHRALFEVLHQQKQSQGTKSVVLTFDPHPLAVIKGTTPPLLTENKLKTLLLREYFDIDKVVTLDFDRQMMNCSPKEFVETVIVNQLKAKHIVVGYNFTFAAHCLGTAEILAELCQAYDIDVTIVGGDDQSMRSISSTSIRENLAKGEMKDANEILGYWFVMEGQVIHGNRLGHSIGFPTANFRPPENQAIPPNGVYAARIEHKGITYDGVVNFGYKPTIGGEVLPLVEAHLFDVDICMYGDTIRVWFGSFLRAEKRFDGIPKLTKQISLDSIKARKFLADIAEDKHLPKSLR